jgi:hypothetical protein
VAGIDSPPFGGSDAVVATKPFPILPDTVKGFADAVPRQQQEGDRVGLIRA